MARAKKMNTKKGGMGKNESGAYLDFLPKPAGAKKGNLRKGRGRK